MPIAENIIKIEERILRSCARAGRKREEITLMGVTKFVPVNMIEEAYRCGIRCFGESRVKEASQKFSSEQKNAAVTCRFEEQSSVKLHLIGSLQRNKAKQALRLFDCIQSADRIELIAELIKHSSDENLPGKKPVEILLEMHTGEESKSGFLTLDDLFKAADMLCACGSLKAAGLMTMAPFTRDADLIRASFRQVVKAQEELEKRFPAENWELLSMGMSNDYETAIEEGSTMLRIGSAIFRD